ncbi:MAG: hypothetical protein J2P15_18950, partial [Micromonosporaceae bacterium]|nr:hypothetical protein [Micromonosporaceae bacterium]
MRRRPDPQRARGGHARTGLRGAYPSIHVSPPGAPLPVVALPVLAAADGRPAGLASLAPGFPAQPLAEAAALVSQTDHTGSPGSLQQLPRPLARPRRVLLVGVGAGDEAGWRA